MTHCWRIQTKCSFQLLPPIRVTEKSKKNIEYKLKNLGNSKTVINFANVCILGGLEAGSIRKSNFRRYVPVISRLTDDLLPFPMCIIKLSYAQKILVLFFYVLHKKCRSRQRWRINCCLFPVCKLRKCHPFLFCFVLCSVQ